jgi:lipopolysaccharide transport system ATP-binding protein
MSDIIIRAESLSKLYKIGALKQRHNTLRDQVVHSVKSLFSGNGRHSSQPSPSSSIDSIWALKDLSFEVKQGEVLGIIGRNGAGKSTLLKILSRITEPTSGRAELYGRVGSLLEVGTGFHPELTGRENIYLSGAILGMMKREINHKLDEIIAFAEVEKFLDTPVKHYSSGMSMRLAFAVAAHLEPEILIIDEVLAVGDAAFQKKCLHKMGNVAGKGRTVLFVSHNMVAIQGLCSRACLLSAGQIVSDGSPGYIVQRYLADISSTAPECLDERTDRQGTGEIRFVGVSMVNSEGRPLDSALCGQDIGIVVSYRSRNNKPVHRVDVHATFFTDLDQFMFNCSSEAASNGFDVLPSEGQIVCHIPKLPLAPGNYVFNLFSTVGGVVADWISGAGTLHVVAGDYFGTGKLRTHEGGFLVKQKWTVSPPGQVITGEEGL